MGGHAITNTAYAAFVAGGLAVVLVWLKITRHRRFLRLQWSRESSFFPFTTRVVRYLAYQGWKVKRGRKGRRLEAVKNKVLIRITCYDHLDVFTETKVKDVLEPHMEHSHKSHARPRSIVCVTANEVPPRLVGMAAAGGVLVLHYTQLTEFTRPAAGLSKYFDDMRKTLAAEFQLREAEAHAKMAAWRGNQSLPCENPPEPPQMPATTPSPKSKRRRAKGA